jgi:AcrR family transcriptional regulator
VFAEGGLGAARHAEIAERAGVAVSTVFVYFPTREDLVRDVLDAVANRPGPAEARGRAPVRSGPTLPLDGDPRHGTRELT